MHLKMVNQTFYILILKVYSNRIMGIGGPSDIDYEGSASYFMGDDDITKYLYAYIIARDCSDKGPYCFEVPNSGDLSIDPENDALLLIERVYLNP
jgi:hypothetical protein